MLKKYALLLDPAIGDAAGGGTETATEARPDSLSGWMTAIAEPAEGDTPPAEPKPKETDGKTAAGGRPADAEPGSKVPVERDADAAAKAKKEAEEKAAAEAAAKSKEKPVEDESEPEEKYPKTSADWDKFKTKRKERETALKTELATRDQAIKDLQAKVQEFESKGGAGADPEVAKTLEAKEATIKQLRERIIELDITKDDEFVSHYQTLTDNAHADAKSILGEERGAAFIKLLGLPEGDYKNSQMEDFYASLNPVEQSEIGGVRRDLRAIDREKNTVIKNAEIAAKTKAADRKTAQQKKADEIRVTYEQTFAKTVKALQDPKSGAAVWQKREDDAEWNKGVEARIEQAKDILLGKGMTPERVVKTAMEAAAYAPVLQGYKAAFEKWESEKASLEAKIAELTAAKPGGKGNAPAEERNGTFELKPGTNPFDASRKFAEMMTAGE